MVGAILGMSGVGRRAVVGGVSFHASQVTKTSLEGAGGCPRLEKSHIALLRRRYIDFCCSNLWRKYGVWHVRGSLVV